MSRGKCPRPICFYTAYLNTRSGHMASGGASPLLVAVNRQVISFISKGSQNILMYNIITTFDCSGGSISARAFSLVWSRHCTRLAKRKLPSRFRQVFRGVQHVHWVKVGEKFFRKR